MRARPGSAEIDATCLMRGIPVSIVACEPTTAAMTALLARQDVANTLRELMARGVPIEEHIDAMLQFADLATAANIATEFRELPAATASLILQA